MSLKTRFGNLGNILDFDNLTEENIYVLESPILTNSQFKKFKNIFKSKIKVIDCTQKNCVNFISVKFFGNFNSIDAARNEIKTLISYGNLNTDMIKIF